MNSLSRFLELYETSLRNNRNLAYRSTGARTMSETVTIKGSCKGYKRGATFELTNGRVWEQTSSNYSYSYSYRPDAQLEASGSRGRLKLDGMDDWVDVKKIK